jgi:hypothetical protein
MCECEKEIAQRFRPYQTKYGYEYGTEKSYKVDGFAPNICPTCRKEREEAHPMKYGGTAVERYYWREIKKTYWKMVLEWLSEKNIPPENSLVFEGKYSEEANLLESEAKEIWQKRHLQDPLYVTDRTTEADFLSQVKVPEQFIKGKCIQTEKNGQPVINWINREGKACPIEDMVADWYRAKGFSVRRCEGKLISVLIGTLCLSVILQPGKSNRIYTGGANLAEGFGSKEFAKNRSEDFEKLITELDNSADLQVMFEDRLEQSKGLRIYIGVEDDYAVELGRIALRTMPRELILKCIRWGFEHFWDHRCGWPDLFVFNDKNFLFAEVKGPRDRLSLDQMNWFKWAIKEVDIPCEIVRVKKSSTLK